MADRKGARNRLSESVLSELITRGWNLFAWWLRQNEELHRQGFGGVTGASYRICPVLVKNLYSGKIPFNMRKPLLNFNLPVALAFVAMLHAALYNVGIELTHLSQGVPIDEEVTIRGSDALAHYHHHSVEEIDSSVQTEMANCFFCLDGIASVGESPWFRYQYSIHRQVMQIPI